jgi:alkanesulfonate monooxygenase SsuD/methylene tetrahydromethanopterin reductase-like flavin-dependent oxidoreductase (luciferase family)
MEIGLYTFGERTPHWADGRAISAQQRLQEILAAAKLADQAGFAVFAVGEHHRLDFAIAATPVVLAAIAQVTARVRLASAVTILSTADPVRVFEDFATVDLLSGGRAEVIAGRGVFTESFPLFGYDLADQDELFAEKLDLLLQLNASERVTWQGRFRPALRDAPIPTRRAGERSERPARHLYRARAGHLPRSGLVGARARCKLNCRSGSAPEEPPAA